MPGAARSCSSSATPARRRQQAPPGRAEDARANGWRAAALLPAQKRRRFDCSAAEETVPESSWPDLPQFDPLPTGRSACAGTDSASGQLAPMPALDPDATEAPIAAAPGAEL
jgi:hypothetical protein